LVADRLTVLGVVSQPFPILGGAHLTHVSFLRRLAHDWGRTVHCLGSAPWRATATVHGLRIRSYRDTEELRQAVLALRPHVLLSTLDAAYAGQRVASRYGIPHLVYADSFEHCPPGAAERRRWLLPPDAAYPDPAAGRELVREADGVLATSGFLRDRLAGHHGVRAHVLYPEFCPDDFRLRDGAHRGPFITAVCGRPFKGLGLFLELARRFPRERFLLAGAVAPALRPRVAAIPNVTVLDFGPARRFLRLSRVLLVPSVWPEPFGRVAVEAMANGIPVLASAAGGLAEIVGDSALAVRTFRDPDAWEAGLAGLLTSAAARAANGREGRRRAVRFLQGASTRRLDRLIRRVTRERRPCFAGRRFVLLDGPANLPTAFSMVNQQWLAGLASHPRYAMTPAPAAGPVADVRIDGDILRQFTKLPWTDDGRLVSVRFWDFGPYPRAWVKVIVEQCDRLWIHSRWIARQAMAGGVPRSRIAVVPHGIDPAVFRPQGPRLPLPTRKPFRFLFVGAPVHRKGIDVLLAAFRRAFTRSDPVTLVIKSNPIDVAYGNLADAAFVRAAARDRTGAEIVLVDRYLSPQQLAALYRACDVGVFPYRAEGFCMPILEAMACGLPSIAPRFGACLDYCSDRTSYLMDVRRVRVDFGRVVPINSRGMREEVSAVDFCEVEVPVLEHWLRRVAAGSETDRRARGRRGARLAHARFTWAHSFRAIVRELDTLSGAGVPVRLRRRRAALERRRRVQATAWALLQGR
jgi:glycosyltransferase involved in cell wall biosynthesis